jgi:hypothetical protein
MVIGFVVSFVVALLIGGLGIYVGARLVAGQENYGYAVVTAFAGAVAWALTSWIPLVGPLVALIVWVWVINWRYRGGWVEAAMIGVVAWLAATIVMVVLDGILGLGIGAFGIPGV